MRLNRTAESRPIVRALTLVGLRRSVLASVVIVLGVLVSSAGASATNPTTIQLCVTPGGQVMSLTTCLPNQTPFTAVSAGALATLQAQVDALQAKELADYNSLTAADGALQGEIDALKQRAKTDEDNITALQALEQADAGHITLLTGLENADSSAIGVLQGQVTTLQGQVKTNTGDITILKAAEATDAAAINTLQTNQSTDEGNITDLQGRVSTLENELAPVITIVTGIKGIINSIIGTINDVITPLDQLLCLCNDPSKYPIATISPLP
jgi:hypothetical protein